MIIKKFKAKKKIKIFKLLIILIFVYVIFQLTFNCLFDLKLENNNKDFVIALLHDSNHHLLYKERKNNYLDKFIKFITNIDLSKPTTILSKKFNYEIKNSSDSDGLDNMSDYIEDPNPIEIKNPRVYIYNTHQLEGYDWTDYSDYNITPNVQMASYLLKDKLNNYNISTIVETGNISDYLKANNWSYNYSYRASRYFLEETLKKNNNLDLIIDLHRDAISREASTIEYDGKKYAKVLFVVGKDYDSYEKNLELANKLNDIFKSYIPNISRGVIVKGGSNVNGIYNQDLNQNIVLIECGGSENTIDEVINTINVLSNVIKDYLGD